MKRWMWSVCIGTLVVVVSFHCTPEGFNRDNVADGEEYFPLYIGHAITYQVDSIVFDDAPGGNALDTVTFQLREEIVATDLSKLNDTIYIIHRSRRNDPGQAWQLKDVWTVTIEELEVLRKEENLLFHKMTFPLRKGLRWNATAYINPNTSVQIGTENLEPYEFWDAAVLDIDAAGEIHGFEFPSGSVMHIRVTDADDNVTKRFVSETYVRGIGLVARTDTILDSRCIELGDFTPCIGRPWLEQADKGYILSQVMIEYE